ncbi:PadR family transcriptional regulator [Streptacidiphilus monticola]|uniref:Helix-turn-helix transcriptional regulator n=1 Tax=Streptacidiphilus monticola TaxID=2161674 RepID=A0ABW1G8F1_9ACTN
MSPVFAHGRLRLYLLKLLDEAPRHGYEVIRLLEERFQGLYAPSAGTVYPRLAKLEQEGLVAHTVEGGRKVYRITDAGRAELAARSGELAELEAEIRDSVAQLADAIREDVREGAQDLREEMRRAARESRRGTSSSAREQVRSAREEARQAKEQARAVREQARAEAQRIKEQMRAHAKAGDWPSGLSEGLSELTRTLTTLADPSRWAPPSAEAPPAQEDLPSWTKVDPHGDPLRELSGLLDRFRDEVRDGARDRGVTQATVERARAILAEAAARLRR